MINSKMIFRILGFLLLIETAMLLCCGGVSLFYEEGDLKKFPNLISSFCRYRRCIARHRQRGGKITQPT